MPTRRHIYNASLKWRFLPHQTNRANSDLCRNLNMLESKGICLETTIGSIRSVIPQQKCVRNIVGVWSECTRSVRKCVGSVGNFDRSPFYFYIDWRKQTQQTMPYGSRERFAATWNSITTGSRRSEMRRTIRSIRLDFPNARLVYKRTPTVRPPSLQCPSKSLSTRESR
jgi:hypothetical protein